MDYRKRKQENRWSTGVLSAFLLPPPSFPCHPQLKEKEQREKWRSLLLYCHLSISIRSKETATFCPHEKTGNGYIRGATGFFSHPTSIACMTGKQGKIGPFLQCSNLQSDHSTKEILFHSDFFLPEGSQCGQNYFPTFSQGTE